MKPNQIVFLVMVIAIAVIVTVVADKYPDKGLALIAIMSFLGLLLGLINWLKPFSGTTKPIGPATMSDAIKAAGKANAHRTEMGAT